MSRARTPADTDRPSVLPQVVPDDRAQLSRKLRISVSDSCNLRCFFCHNEGQGPVRGRPNGVAVTIDEYRRIVRAAVDAGVREIKLTGGEPLLYRDGSATIVDLVRALRSSSTRDLFGLSMTTNGLLLERYASGLAAAGLDRVTISLHTLDTQTFVDLMGEGRTRAEPGHVVAGLKAAVAAGLTPVKVNTVLFDDHRRGVSNVDEIARIVDLCRTTGVSQLRLYTLLKHEHFPKHGDWYRFWDPELLSGLGRALGCRADELQSFARTVTEFLDSSRSQLYPRPHLLLNSHGLDVVIEAMESGQFDDRGLPDEGPYALRLSAVGDLRGIISDRAGKSNILATIRSGDPEADDVLRQLFGKAVQEALPKEDSQFQIDGEAG
jgi:molybdenum cofactor biosynthesis enzyme MoaA